MEFVFFAFFLISCQQRFSKSFEQNIVIAFDTYVLDETVLDFMSHVSNIEIYLRNFNHIKFFFGGEYSFERKPFANPLAAFFKIKLK